VLKLSLGDGLAEHLYELSHAIDDRAVEPERETKSVGSEETFADDVVDAPELRRHLLRMADNVARRCRANGLTPRTITLKIRYGDFSNISRSKTLDAPIDTSQAIMAIVDELLDEVDVASGVRLAGISARNFAEPDPQLSLFADTTDTNGEWREAARVVDRIRERFGDGAIATGAIDDTGSTPWGPRRE
jgi:DNA polymerase-4